MRALCTYICTPVQAHEALAILGLHSIEQLLDTLTASHDWAAWQQLLGLLVPVVHAQLEGVLQATQQLQVGVRARGCEGLWGQSEAVLTCSCSFLFCACLADLLMRSWMRAIPNGCMQASASRTPVHVRKCM